MPREPVELNGFDFTKLESKREENPARDMILEQRRPVYKGSNIPVDPPPYFREQKRSQSAADWVRIRSSSTATSCRTPSKSEVVQTEDRIKIKTRRYSEQQCLLFPRSRTYIIGKVAVLAQDYHGCRFLQTCLQDGGRPIFKIIYSEVISDGVQLAEHHIANYLCQKILEKCCRKERHAFLVALKDQLVDLCFHTHGRRVIQKLIELGSQQFETSLISCQVRPQLVSLCQNPNGIHSIQSCLSVNARYNGSYDWIFTDVAANCMEISKNSVSCCIVQRCLDQASPYYQAILSRAVIDHVFDLVADPFGNYVVQTILGVDDRRIVRILISKLVGSAYQLAILKFSSNVIEKCLQVADEDILDLLLNELFQNGDGVGQALCDPFANYCVQAALRVTEGYSQHKFDHLIQLIQPFMPLLELTPFRQRIYAKMLKHFPALHAREKISV